MDIVFIRELQIATIIGVHPWEREVRQSLTFDLDMASDIKTPAKTGNVRDALDYQAVGERISSLVESSDCQLLETLAERVAELVLNDFSVSWLRLRISKPGALPNARVVGVVIERGTQT
ncbi:MAG: dihydroneopterin aldolase [Pseudomonadales bacterium]